MNYVKLPRARRALALFLTSSLLLVWFPTLDLRLSSLFYGEGGFYLAHRWWATLLHECVGGFISVGLAAVLGIYAFNRFSQRNICGVDGKVVAYLFVVLILGAGLIVNVVFKNSFGRARPRNVTQFGGSQQFTPVFELTNECTTNCSFPSGDAAGAFFSLALALALSRRRAVLVAATVFGVLVSLSRIASGAHFLSDTVVSYFLMWILADVMHFYILLPRHGTVQALAQAVRVSRESPVRAAQGLGQPQGYARMDDGDAGRGAR
jgi:lipid A 4'-phosphatase